MLLVNLVVVPALMIAGISVVELDPIYAAGLVVFGMAAGAPFLIKLICSGFCQRAGRDAAEGWPPAASRASSLLLVWSGGRIRR